jgi:hypothetical protein
VEFIDEVLNGVEHGVNVPFIIAYHGKTDLCPLPQVVVSHFRNGDIKLVFGPINKLPDNLSFSLERIIAVNSKIQLADSDNHESF